MTRHGDLTLLFDRFNPRSIYNPKQLANGAGHPPVVQAEMLNAHSAVSPLLPTLWW